MILNKLVAGICFGLAFNCLLLSQEINDLPGLELELFTAYNKLLEKDPFSRDEPALEFYNRLAEILTHKGSFQYLFDSLKNIGLVYSPDNSLRIVTWNIPVGLNEHLYFGVAQYYSSADNALMVVKLNNPVGVNQLKKIGTWSGALYYEIVVTKHAGQKYYTLLGFSFNNALSNMKYVDIVSIDDFNELYFCKDLVKYQGKTVDRIVFEYNEKATMILRYDQQKKMIVFDHLSPSKPSLEGKYEFYGPDFTYDGLKFEKGTWVHYPNIEITN